MPRDPRDPRSITDQLHEELLGRTFNSSKELDRFLQAQANAYNTRPQKELGGLTPDQLHRLLYSGDWVDGASFSVNYSLTPDELGDPDMLHNARMFLTSLRDEGPAKLTKAGYVNREFITRILDRLRFPPRYLEDVRLVNKVLNEPDVGKLSTVRDLLEVARLTHLRKGVHISPLGRKLLDEGRQGELFALLFRTFFQRLDLRTLYGMDGNVGLQQSIAFTFWKLRSAAGDWATEAHLMNVAWLETMRDPPRVNAYGDIDDWFPAGCFRHRVLEPLIAFGVLEYRELPRGKRAIDARIEVRKTPLFDRFFRFDI